LPAVHIFKITFCFNPLQFDVEKFNDEYADLKYFQGKTGRKKFSNTQSGQSQRGKAKGAANGMALGNDFAVLDKLGGGFNVPGKLQKDAYMMILFCLPSCLNCW
jgi:hypothetical protein